MTPAFKTHSRTLFSAAAAVVLGLQVAPWPSTILAEENTPAPLIVQSTARPIVAPPQGGTQPQYNNPQRPAQSAAQPQFRSGPPQYPKSEVQRELEKLYEQNGRAVPEMVDPQIQKSTTGGSAGGVPQSGQAQTYSQPQSYSAGPGVPAAPVSAPKKKGIFSKLFGSRDDGPTQPPVEPPYMPPTSALPMTPPASLSGPPAGQQPPAATGRPNYSQIFEPSGQAPGAVQPSQQPQVQLYQPYVVAPQNQVPAQSPAATVVPRAGEGFEAPRYAEAPVPLETGNSLPAIDFSAPLVEPDTVDLGQPAPLNANAPVAPADPFSFEALFPASTAPATAAPAAIPSQSVAVEPLPAAQVPSVEEEAPVEENPYSGLTLDADPFSNPAALKATTVAPGEIRGDDVEVPEETVEARPAMRILPQENRAEAPPVLTVQPEREFNVPNPEESADEPPLVVEQSESPARLEPAQRPVNDRTRAKQEMIAARKGLPGLKGFCPVVLRDDRDLVDAHSQFRVIYNSKTYYLSSSQAVAAFHSDPAKYAPAARGCDVIQEAVSGEEIEGSLDHAVWYKGRLYLFTSAETMDTFVSAPSSHSTLD